MVKRLWLAFFLLSCLSLSVFAEQLIGVGSSRWNHRDDRSGAVGCITVADGNSTCKLFPAGNGDELVSVFTNVSASGAANCAFVGDGATSINTAGHVASGGSFSTGASAGFAMATPGTRHDTKPAAKDLVEARMPGMENGFCTLPVVQNGLTHYVPCRTGGGGTNCAAYNSANLGSCIAPNSTQYAQAGLFVVCNGIVHAWIEKVTH